MKKFVCTTLLAISSYCLVINPSYCDVSDIYGKWTMDDGIAVVGKDITFYPDGKVLLTSLFDDYYTIDDSRVTIHATNIWGKKIIVASFTYSINNDLMTVSPPFAGASHWKKIESFQASNNETKINIIELKLDNKLTSKVVKESPAYKVPKGQEKIVEDSVRLVHTVTTTNTSSIDESLKSRWGFIEKGIRSEIQKSTSKSDAVETEVKRSVRIIGDGQTVKVVWNELYRTGTAKIVVDGKTSVVPFEYKEDFDLTLEATE